jgi:methionine aminotransferase
MSKLPHVGTTIFSVMSKLASETSAINLSQGFPNFPIDTELKNILRNSADKECHQYAPMGGLPSLLNNIASLIEKSYSRSIHPEKELLITAGATQGIFTVIMALIEQGDEVIILDPSYDCYEPAVVLAGGKAIRIPLNIDFTPNWNAIQQACSSKTKMIITNNPHNPSGKTWNEADFTQLEAILNQNEQIILLSDEVYEYITFEDKHISANTRDKLINRTVITSSFGKTFHITGWKMGYLVAPEHLMVEIKKVHQFNVFSVNSVAQAVLSEYITKVNVNELGTLYQEKRDLFQSLLSKSRFKLLPCEGTYFQVADYSAISSENDVDFCKTLTVEHGVAAIPISVFNANKEDHKMIRFCFAKDDDTLIKAAERLCKI